jgi:hypothetical protein
VKKTIPLYWDPQDGTNRIRIGNAVVDDETFELEASITTSVLGNNGLQRRLREPMLDLAFSAPTKYRANLKDLMPPGTVLAPDAKINFGDEVARDIYPENYEGDDERP